jgi:hypothetical protein
MKITLSDLLIPAIVLGAAGWWGYSSWTEHVEKDKAEHARLEASAREENALAAIAHQHQATRALTARLSTESGPVFTYQVQNALSASSGKAVIITGRLADIEKREGQYVLHLDDASVGSLLIRYVLECDSKIAEPLLAKRAGADSLTAVVQVTSVEKAEFRLFGGKNEDKESNPARDEGAPFVARGRCLEIVVR